MNLLGSTSLVKTESSFETASLDQNPYLRNNCIESNIEKNNDVKKQNKMDTLPTPIDPHRATS